MTSFAPDAPDSYSVDTPVYQGPMDLLLQLIERAELDITKVALAEVTDQFLEHMRQLQQRHAEEVSGFLVIASRLMQIKSEALLPRPVIRQPEEEDPGEALVQQLILYKRYKELASLLSERQTLGLRSYLRLAPPPKVEGKLDLSGINTMDLYEAARRAFREREELPPLETVVTAPRVTIRDKIRVIADRLRQGVSAKFSELFGNEEVDRLQVVVTFLAMLELVRRYRVSAQQESLFGEIELQRAEEWDDDLDFEIEFAE